MHQLLNHKEKEKHNGDRSTIPNACLTNSFKALARPARYHDYHKSNAITKETSAQDKITGQERIIYYRPPGRK